MFIRVRRLGYLFLLAISTVIVVVDFQQRILAGANLTPTEGVKIVPQEATVAAFVTSDPQQWRQFKSFLAPPVENDLMETYSNWLSQIVIVSQTNYRQAIQPWLGNIVFALIPEPAQAGSNNFLIVAGIRNKVKAYTFGKAIENASRLQKSFKTYENAPVVEVSDRQSTIFLSLVNNKLLVSDSMRVIERAIETSKSERSFLERIDLEELSQLEDATNSIAQVFIPHYADLHQSISQAVPIFAAIPSEVESVLIDVKLDRAEMQVDAIALLNTEATKKCQALTQDLSRTIDAQLAVDIASHVGSFASRLNAGAGDRCLLQKTLKQNRLAQQLSSASS